MFAGVEAVTVLSVSGPSGTSSASGDKIVFSMDQSAALEYWTERANV